MLRTVGERVAFLVRQGPPLVCVVSLRPLVSVGVLYLRVARFGCGWIIDGVLDLSKSQQSQNTAHYRRARPFNV